MAKKETENQPDAAIATQRFNEFLEMQRLQGVTQAEIAVRAGIPPQYLSDIKRGVRPVTELIARRLAGAFIFDYRWLLGIKPSMELPMRSVIAASGSTTVRLPLLTRAIEGEPRLSRRWTGTEVELAGVAAGKVGLATLPYVLQLDRKDTKRRVKKGDLILISQAPNSGAEIQIIRYRGKSLLVRANRDGSWARIDFHTELPSDSPVTGHCIGIVWAALV